MAKTQHSPRFSVAAAASTVLLLGALSVAAVQWEQAHASELRSASEAHRPRQVLADGYVSSNACRGCHPSEYQSWSRSYHRSMTQVATPATVFGDFSGVQLGTAPFYRLDRDRNSDRFLFAQKAIDSEPWEEKPVSLVTGSHHMQIYWYETGDSRKVGQVPFVYLNADQRWVPRAAVFLQPPTAMRRPDESGRWNYSCLTCHTTQGRPRMDDQGHFDTEVAELGIACEACHGPAQAHVAKNTSPLARYVQHLDPAADSSIVHPGRLDHQRASEICSQCHSLWQDNDAESVKDWNAQGFKYRPGQDAATSRWLMQPSQRNSNPRVNKAMTGQAHYVEGQFWSDGMARVSGREFSGMIDSPCYVQGELSCLSCHTMHKRKDDPRSLTGWADDQLGAGMAGDQGCVQCHASFASDSARAAHSKHDAQSEGSRCYNCHMPHTTYGLLKAMRSHRISVPSVAETVETGRPNACNLCHLDKSLGWTAAQLRERYGKSSTTLPDDPRELPLALWLGLTGDAGQRALIAWALGWQPAQQAMRGNAKDKDKSQILGLLGVLMDDPYDAVRYIAGHSLRALPGVDGAKLDYDFVPRPDSRPSVSERVIALAPFSDAEAARLQAIFSRLTPQRDRRAVLLLE